MSRFQNGEQVFSARKNNERSVATARYRAKIQKIPSFFKTVDIHAGGIRTFVVSVFVGKSALEEEGKIFFYFRLIGLFLHAHSPLFFSRWKTHGFPLRSVGNVDNFPRSKCKKLAFGGNSVENSCFLPCFVDNFGVFFVFFVILFAYSCFYPRKNRRLWISYPHSPQLFSR